MEQVLLLVDDEENIVRALVRLLRREGYTILTAHSGAEGLEILKENKVCVILSDQRMPEMNGTEFLSRVKDLYPDTVRIVLSGYTDLNSVTDAINHGAIYKFLTKPWDDELLKENIKGAFNHLELIGENQRLTNELQHANALLANDNRKLSKDVGEKSRTLEFNIRALEIAQEVLEKLPVAVLGIGDDGIIAVANKKAQELVSGGGPIVGMDASDILQPALLKMCQTLDDVEETQIEDLILWQGGEYAAYCRRMGEESCCAGSVLVLMKKRASE